MVRANALAGRLTAVRTAFETACGIVLILFTGLVLYSVAMRYFFSNPPIWGEDIPKLLFVWLSFVGGGLAYMLGFNIRMTSFVERLSRPVAVAVELAMRSLNIAMLVVVVWYSMPIIDLALGKRVLSTGMSDVWTYLPLPIGAVLMIGNELVRMVLAVVDKPTEDDSAMHSGM